MTSITPLKTIDALRAHYGEINPVSKQKVVTRLTPLHAQWILSSRFCVISTVGGQGTDASPRGDVEPVVQALDDKHLLLPDWRGNNRLDTLENVIADPRVSLMFFHNGERSVVRVNGTAVITADHDILARFDKDGRLPITVMVITINELYVQCGRAVMRSNIWQETPERDVPTMGQLIAEATDHAHGGGDYDADWLSKAQKTLWRD